jgi:predicted ATPase/DNA-binding SARP family transcriptional activator
MRPPGANVGGTETGNDVVPVFTARLLGRTQLATSDATISDRGWPRRSARSLLLLLLATPGHRLPRDIVVDRLWPQARPGAGLSSYYQAVRALRRVIETHLSPADAAAFIEVARNEIAVSAHVPCWIDVDAFETAVAAAASAGPDRRDRLRAAVALYAGGLLTDEPVAEWMIARREQLHVAWQRATLDLAELDRLAGEPLATVASLEDVVASDPTSEDAHRALIQAFLAAGQRTRALRQYERCRRSLLDDLGIEPSADTQALLTTLRAPPGAQPVTADNAARWYNLPAPANRLVGREREIEAIQDLLWRPDVRLVTLTGPGGVGKTRLALEGASTLADDFAAGVCFVALAPISDSRLTIPTIAKSLGVREVGSRPLLERLQEHLRELDLLLMLDNFEQVVTAAPDIADLLATCPKLKMLVTSRTPLRISAEHELDVPPLASPPAESFPSFSAIARSDAVTLFVQRAQAVRGDFALTEQNAEALAEICRRLDGLPLAIELAAARSKILSPTALLARLTHRLEVLTGGPRDAPDRLRTMRDAIAWSYDLLDPDQQVLFRRLSVFVGGFRLEAAEHVGRESGAGSREYDGLTASDSRLPSPVSVLDGVEALVGGSLLRVVDQEDGGTRYEMLETIREFGLERLEASGESDSIRERLATYLIAFGEATIPPMTFMGQEALDNLTVEMANVRAAIIWALDRGDAETSLRLIVASFSLWIFRANPSDARQWLDTALAMDAPVAETTRAQALFCASGLASFQGDRTEATRLAEESLAISRAHGNAHGVAVALLCLGIIAEWEGDLDLAATHYAEALGLERELDKPYWIALFLSNLADVTLWLGETARAAEYAEEGLLRWRQAGTNWGIALSLGTVAAVASEQGDQPRAAQLYRECLSLHTDLGDRRGIAGTLAGVAGVALAWDDEVQAARLLGAARAMGDAIGVSQLTHHVQYERNLAATRDRMGEPAFAIAFEAGRALPPEVAIREAVELAPSTHEPIDAGAKVIPFHRRRDRADEMSPA